MKKLYMTILRIFDIPKVIKARVQKNYFPNAEKMFLLVTVVTSYAPIFI